MNTLAGTPAATNALARLPTLRLRGLYLALATFAFASAADLVFFNRVFGAGGALNVPRLHLPGLSAPGNSVYFTELAVAFVGASLIVLAVRRGRYGRELAALNDSPAACATLGVNINVTKLAVFAVSAGLAGFAGALFGGLRGQVGPNDFVALVSLTMLLILRVGGINTVTGALFGGVVLATFPLLQEHVPSNWPLSYLLTGIAAVSIGRDPNGIGGRVRTDHVDGFTLDRGSNLPDEFSFSTSLGVVGGSPTTLTMSFDHGELTYVVAPHKLPGYDCTSLTLTGHTTEEE